MKMTQTVRALSGIGRSAFVGTLVGLVSAQAFAGGLTESLNAPSQPNTAQTAVATENGQNATAKALTGFSSSASQFESLPSAPEIAKVVPTAPLNPMVAEAAQSEQSMMSTPKTSNKRVQRPGMLAMGIAGIPLMAVGIYFYAYPTKATAAKTEFGSIFFVPGAAMSAIGFPLAFHKKK